MVAWALGLQEYDVSDVMARKQFVCTAEIALKLLIIHERRMAMCPLIIEGETGCGKSFPLEIYSLLINKVEDMASNALSVAPRVQKRTCEWIQNNLLSGCQYLGETEEEKVANLDAVCEAGSMHANTAVSAAAIFRDIRSADVPSTDSLVKYWTLLLEAGGSEEEPDGEVPIDHPTRGFVAWARALPERCPLFAMRSKELSDLYGLSDELIDQLFFGTIEDAVQFSARLMGLLLNGVVSRSVYHRMMVHPSVTG
jgi:hypothetical protein